jgi:linoleoyl-CoA desaturase
VREGQYPLKVWNSVFSSAFSGHSSQKALNLNSLQAKWPVMKISFTNTDREFTLTLNKSVNEYFVARDGKKTGTAVLYLKTVILLVSLVLVYWLLVFRTLPVWIAVLLCVLLGLNLAAIGFNVMHDAVHGSYSGKKWLNYLMGFSLNLMGGSMFIWIEKHNISHHSFTNIEGHDEDIDIQPWIRTNRNQPYKPMHRYQHIYWPFFYSLSYLIWVTKMDFEKYFSGKIAGREMKKMSTGEHFIFWASKLSYVFIFVAFPVIMLGWKALIGYFIAAGVCGFVISIVFQLAHVVENADFPFIDESREYTGRNWSMHQVATTADFATQNKFVTWILGGLNFQIEHHLFPRISHVHYPGMSRIVKNVCRQFSIPYIEFPGFFSAVRSHIRYLKSMGRENGTPGSK